MAYEKTDDESLLIDVKDLFNEADSYFGDLYDQGRDDMRFLYGENQWDQTAIIEREKNNRPYLVLNQLAPYAKQVVNDIRQARIAIRVSPVDDQGDPKTAEIMQGIIRNIERQSKANDAYELAVKNAVGAGYGWIRVRTDYCNPMSFDQEIKIERIINFESVYIDPESTSLDGSDAEYCFIFDDISADKFEELYPDADPVSVDMGDWLNNDNVRIAEHYYKEYKEREIVLAKILDPMTGKEKQGVVTRDEFNAIEEEGGAIEEIESRTSNFPVINYCKFNGQEILEQSEWLGEYIPVVPVYCDEVFIDGKRESHSLIRQAKDAQRMFNYWKTASTEFIALQQKAPFIGPLGSFNSRADQWANSNRLNLPYLEYDVVHDENNQRVEPPQRQQPVMGSPAMMQEAASAREDIRLALGMPQANMGETGREISGVAIRNRQIEGDNATFHITANLAASISQVGVILVDLIPRLYSEEKIMRILGEDGKEDKVPVNQPYVKDEDGYRPAEPNEKSMGVFDLTTGKYDVVTDVGASYSSKRQETADKLIEISRAKPEILDIAGDILFDVLDVPRGDEIAERMRAQMSPEMLGDDPQAAKLQQAAQALKQMEERILNYEAALDEKKGNEQFEQSYKMGELELQREELKIKADKTRADIAKIQAEIAGTNTDTTQAALQTLGGVVNSMNEQVQDLAQAMEIQLAFEEQGQAPSEPVIEEELIEQENQDE